MSHRIISIITAIILPTCLAVATICSAQVDKKPVLSDTFAREIEGWKPRAGIKLKLVNVKGVDGKCLKVKGIQKGAWNYAGSPSFKLQPGRIYRITARLLVKNANPKLPPYFKVELAKAGRIRTTVYDLAKGGWQELTGHFRCPEKSKSAWDGLEKGGKFPVEIEAYIADVKVVEVKKFQDPHFAMGGAMTGSIKPKHPQLFFTDSDLKPLRKRAKSQHLVRYYKAALSQAKRALKTPVVKQNAYWRSREILNIIIPCAFIYNMTGEKKYADRAKKEMLAAANWKAWDMPDWRELESSDLVTGETSFALGCGYDWLYNILSEAERKYIRNSLLNNGIRPFLQSKRERRGWAGIPPNNWTAVVSGGVGIAALAILDEEPEAVTALGYARKGIQRYITSNVTYGKDGGYFEGVMYWRYGTQYLLLFAKALESVMKTDDNILSQKRLLKSAWFPIYFTAPDGHAVNFSDSGLGGKYGVNLAGLFASRFEKLGRAEDKQAFLWWTTHSKNPLWGMSVFGFLWRPDEPAPDIPPRLEKVKLFSDINWAVIRSKPIFKPDIYLAFKSGNTAVNHSNNDLNSFLLVVNGERLTRDPGYGIIETKDHSSILINGQGQNHGTKGKILRCGEGNGYMYILGDASESYGNELQLFHRHIVFINEGHVIAIVDELKADKPSTFQWLLHSELPIKINAKKRSATLKGKRSGLTVKSLLPVKISGRVSKWRDNVLEIKNSKKEETLLFVTILNPFYNSKVPFDASVSRQSNSLSIQTQTGSKIDLIKFKTDTDGKWQLAGVNDSRDGHQVGLLKDDPPN